MPYTPPSPSPNASHTQSRTNSRSSSFSEVTTPPSSTLLMSPSKPQQTRSTSYLNKHRRSVGGGSRPADDKLYMMSPPGGSGPIIHPPRSTSGSSIRQVTTVPMMSTGVVISPPDSSQNSSDDETENRLKRGRQLVDVKELEAAIRNSIAQRREASPVTDSKKTNEVFAEKKSPQILSARIHEKLSHVTGHSRSVSDVTGSKKAITVQTSQEKESEETSPDIDDDGFQIAPPMVRKKSGELVKSSLKSPNLRRRPSSMPSTPTYPKVVHFDSHLEHVRHFLHSERPTAVSAGSSPVESAIDNETEYPFPVSEEPPFEWEIGLPNFPDRVDRSSWVVRVEKVVLSHDKKALLGTVAVANLSFQKLVVARFTLDYWQTTSEVVAEFTNDFRRRQQDDGYDRFTFKIKLEDMANLENKTLFFCVRYRLQDQEHWDNNSSMNYQVDFKKKPIPQNGKSGPSSSTSRPLPRSKGNTTAPAARPRSMPIFDDAFDAYDLKTQPEYKMFANTTDRQRDMRLAKSNKKTSVVDAEALARRANPSGNAFGNRYDFEASLAAAMATATQVLGPERSGLKLKTPKPKEEKPAVPNPYFQNLTVASNLPRSHSSPSLSANFATDTEKPVPRVELNNSTESFKPSLDALKKLSTQGKPSVESASYKEILENFCFFGSAKNSPQLATGSVMPAKTGSSGYESNLNVLNYRTSRSPSPTSKFGSSQGLDGTNGRHFITSPASSSSQGSQKGSRSPSPSHIYGFPAAAFDVRAPIIQT